MNQARAILWAQWRTLRNVTIKRSGIAISAIIGTIWYGFWLLAAFGAARIIANPGEAALVKTALPGALLIVFLYWQIVPVLMATTGASLELRKLKAYPIPISQMFAIEVMLRVTAGIEMLLVLIGIAIGAALNPELPFWAALAIVPYILFNLFLAAGLRDVLVRLLARKRIREVVIFLMVMATTLPRLMLMSDRAHRPTFTLFSGDVSAGSPWGAAANMLQGHDGFQSFAILLLWTGAFAALGRWQFARTLAFDAEAAASGDTRPVERRGIRERIFRFPSTIFADPLGALIEKEIRFLARSPRFRLVFLMGFTFGVVIMLPVSLGRSSSQSFISSNYLTAVSVYALLLLSESCFWNSFGFDRSAAQFYFLAPIPFSRVLVGKNVSALFFIGLEIAAITVVCLIMGMPLPAHRLAEAYGVAAVVTIYLLCAGNLMSVHHARAVNPNSQFRSSAAGRVQAMLLVIYPIALLPAGVAYAARFAFDAHPDLAFFGVLAFAASVGLILYRFALESSVEFAERTKEQIIAALSRGDGPIAG